MNVQKVIALLKGFGLPYSAAGTYSKGFSAEVPNTYNKDWEGTVKVSSYFADYQEKVKSQAVRMEEVAIKFMDLGYGVEVLPDYYAANNHTDEKDISTHIGALLVFDYEPTDVFAARIAAEKAAAEAASFERSKITEADRAEAISRCEAELYEASAATNAAVAEIALMTANLNTLAGNLFEANTSDTDAVEALYRSFNEAAWALANATSNKLARPINAAKHAKQSIAFYKSRPSKDA